MDLSLLWMPSDVSSTGLLHTAEELKQVGCLGSGLRGAHTVWEGGEGSKALAGDCQMRSMHRSLYAAHMDPSPALGQALG